MTTLPTITRNCGDGERIFRMARYERVRGGCDAGCAAEILEGVPHIYGADKRPEKLEWMIRQAKSITGK